MKTEVSIPQPTIESFIFANTPSYLLKKLLNDGFVDDLSSESEIDLFDMIKAADTADVASIAGAYAAAVALLKQGVPSAKISELQGDTPLAWLSYIAELYSKTVPASSTVSIRFPKIIDHLSATQSAETSIHNISTQTHNV